MCHIQPDLDILFVKLIPQIGDCIWKTPSAHYTSRVGNFNFFFSNIFNGDLYIDASITDLFWISLVVSQTLGVGTLVQISLLMFKGRGEGVSSALGTNDDCVEVSFAGQCMVSCHSCHIYRIWRSRSKEVWGTLCGSNTSH